jgi:transposase-like protein
MSAPQKFYTAEEDARILQLYAERVTIQHIANALGRTKPSVESRLRRLREEHNMHPPITPWPDNGDALLADMWMQGRSVAEMAEEIGTTAQRVKTRLDFIDLPAKLQGKLLDRAHALHGQRIGPREMLLIAGAACGVPPLSILGPSRLKVHVCARFAIARALADRGMSLSYIARAVGRADHTTSRHYIVNFGAYCRVYPQVLEAYQAIKDAEAAAAERRAA